MMIVLQWLPLTVLLIDLVIKIIALGTIPRNRRPSSSLAWLLLITITPVFGLILSAARLCVVAGSGSRPRPTR
jgi:cardiolipin synthase